MTTTKQINNMTQTKITPEIVKELYIKYHNKMYFLAIFGTTKFHIVDEDFLKRMHNFLINKVK